jgi:hypothetical protein
MKKIILPLLILGFLFTSCEGEDLNSQIEMDAIAAKTKISKEKSETESNSEDGNCETAFGRYCSCASLNTCFIDMDYGFNRWGWSVRLDKHRTERFGLYAGVGQCDMSKGTPVGGIDVTFNKDGTVTLGDFEPKSGYSLKEFHFYAGDTEVPIGKNGRTTVAPGQYYNEGDYNNDGVVYVIIHAVICGDFEE